MCIFMPSYVFYAFFHITRRWLNDHSNKQQDTCSCLLYSRLPDIKEQLKIADLSAFMSGPGCMVNTMSHSSGLWGFKYNCYTLKRQLRLGKHRGQTYRFFSTDFMSAIYPPDFHFRHCIMLLLSLVMLVS